MAGREVIELTAAEASVHNSATGQLDQELGERCRKAPRYGVNAKFLILQYASRLSAVDGPGNVVFESGGTPLPGHPRSESRDGEKNDVASIYTGQDGIGEHPLVVNWQRLPGNLLDSCVPKPEFPIVQFVLRPKVPRALRQGTANHLANQHLAMAAASMGATDRESAETIVRSNANVRSSSLAAALAQEKDLYRRSSGKAEYQKAARTVMASTDFMSPGLCSHNSSEAAGVSHPEGELKPTGGLVSASNQTPAEAEEGTAALLGDVHPQGAQCGDEEPPLELGGGSGDVAGDADEAEEGTVALPSEVHPQGPQCGDEEPQSEVDGGSGDVAGDADEAGEAVERGNDGLEGVDTGTSAPGNVEGCMTLAQDKSTTVACAGEGELPVENVDSFADAAGEKPCRDEAEQDTAAAQEDASPEKQCQRARIKDQVAAFIRGILDPFWRAGTIDRETYKRVLQRAASKVAAAHAGAKDARFLIAESDKIHKLVKQYLMQ